MARRKRPAAQAGRSAYQVQAMRDGDTPPFSRQSLAALDLFIGRWLPSLFIYGVRGIVASPQLGKRVDPSVHLRAAFIQRGEKSRRSADWLALWRRRDGMRMACRKGCSNAHRRDGRAGPPSFGSWGDRPVAPTGVLDAGPSPERRADGPLGPICARPDVSCPSVDGVSNVRGSACHPFAQFWGSQPTSLLVYLALHVIWSPTLWSRFAPCPHAAALPPRQSPAPPRSNHTQ